MSDPLTVLKAVLAHELCDVLPCSECKRMFGTDRCLTDEYDYDTRIAFCRQLGTKLKDSFCDLGEFGDLNIDDLLRVVNESASVDLSLNVDEPAMLEDHPVDYRAIAEEIEMPF